MRRGVASVFISGAARPLSAASFIQSRGCLSERDRSTGFRSVVGYPLRVVPEDAELTPHERHVLDLLAQGLDSGTIAAHVGLTGKIVDAEVQSIMQKLGVHSRLEAAKHHVLSDKDFELRTALRELPPRDRGALLRWLLADEEDRDDIASQALKRNEGGAALAEYIATLTMQPEQRQRFVRLLRDIESEGH